MSKTTDSPKADQASDHVAIAEVPTRISPEHINLLLGLDNRGHKKPQFSVPEPRECRAFMPAKLKYVEGLELDKNIPADIFYVYWFFLRREREFLPDSFCDRTKLGETALYLFTGLSIACHIDGYCSSVYPCMRYHDPKIGIHSSHEKRWEFSHVPIHALALESNRKFFRNVRTVILPPLV